jgi:hypothetical protein
MNFLKNLKRYLYAHIIWVSKVKSLWGVVLPFALLLFILLLPNDLNNLVRYVGLVLELLGLITVAFGLKGKRELFKKPSFVEHVTSWWNQRPAWKPVTIIACGAFASANSFFSAKASIWHGAIDETVESRLAALENNLLSIRSEIQLIEQDANSKHSKLIHEIENEQQTRQSSILELSKRLEDMAAKDIGFEALGVYWLCCGLVFSSLPSEIADLLNYWFAK